MKKAVIVVDNLRIGGFQRLSLDQSYGLSDLGFQVKLIVLAESNNFSIHSLHEVENLLVSRHGINVVYAGNTHMAQIKVLRTILRRHHDPDLLLCHSLRGTILLRLVQIGRVRRKSFSTTIHQLPSLSEFGQRWRRIFYAQFSDLLFAYSESVKLDWQRNIANRGKLAEIFFRKQITVVRNGIYLERLPRMASANQEALAKTRPRLIYLGRNTIWKGLGTYFQLLDFPELNGFDFLLMVPSTEGIPTDLLNRHGARIQVLVGKTISDLEARQGDVHIYPTNYGAGVDLVESVSLNVLEFGAIGIPSVLSRRGSSTWPELVDSGLLCEVDWIDEQEISTTIMRANQFILDAPELDDIRNQISIIRNLNKMMDLLSRTKNK